MKIKFKHKLIGLTTVAALLPIIVVIILVEVVGNHVKEDVKEELRRQTLLNISQIAKDVYSLCETSNSLLIETVTHNLNVARDVIKRNGGIELSNSTVKWQALNQYTKEVTPITLPKLVVGNKWLGQNRDFGIETFAVDDAEKLVGGTITIFQRINEAGDMLRVATNVKKLDGTRAIGTFIPAVNPDGTPNPVVSKIMNGETYTGRAFVVNAWYITIYEPILDNKGNLIGMLYAGIQQEAVASVTNSIKNIVVGKTGNVFVFGGKGDDNGKIIISSDGKGVGEIIYDFQDEETKKKIQHNFSTLVNSKNGEVVTEHYDWKEFGQTEAKHRLTAMIYYEPWDWIIVPTTYDEDFNDVQANVDSSLDELIIYVLLGGIVIFVLTIIGSSLFGTKISGPISGITEISQLISNGKVQQAKENVERIKNMIRSNGSTLQSKLNKLIYNPGDETSRLLISIENMTEQLDSMIKQLKNSSFLLSSTSADISTTSREQEATIAEFNSTTSQVAASSQEISTTTNNLVNTMEDVTKVANETKELADSGKQSIDDMSGTIRNLSGVTQSVSTKLDLINKNADNISDIIVTITKVADQTNLLSLNAAIEAEKAGKYGKGFSVVAKEIRRLADQTAVATLDIENMIKEMQNSVKSGVSEMDKFFVEVHKSVSLVEAISERLEKIIGNVQKISPQFVEVNEGMLNQAQGAEQINDAILQLSSTAEQTASAIKGFNNVAVQLNDAVKNLEDEISRFQSS